jgi:hypothetical protein
MKIAALGDRDTTHLTHREIDATLALLPDDVDCGWVATDSARARARALDGLTASGCCPDQCGFGLADAYEPVLAGAGVVISAHAPDAGVEGIELSEHPFFMATAFQPQVGSSASGAVHPLIAALLDAAAARLQPQA